MGRLLHAGRHRRNACGVCRLLHLSHSPSEDRLMLKLLGVPIAASAHAAEIDQMTALVHWLMLVLFVGWGAFFIFALIRFRKGANPKACYVGANGKLAQCTVAAVELHEASL